MNKKIKSHCNNCIRITNHDILHAERNSDQEEIDNQFDVSWGENYLMVKCCGCENISLRHESWFSEDTDSEGNPETKVKYYPPAISRQLPKWMTELNKLSIKEESLVCDLLKEIYIALQNDSRRLATMGTRALLEHIMISKVGDNGSFVKNINKFLEQGYLAANQKEILETALEAGHATMHRAYHPSVDELVSVIDITEGIIETVYIHSKKAKKLKIKIPKKQKKL